MAQNDVHYFDTLHRILLDRLQSGNLQSTLTLLALPHVHANPLFWQTCTYPAGLAAAVLAASFGPQAEALAAAPTAVGIKTDGGPDEMTWVPATPSLSLTLHMPLTMDTAEESLDGPDVPVHTQLIGGTPAAPSPSPATTTAPTTTATTTTSTTTAMNEAGAATSAFTLPELYQLVRFCLDAAPATARHGHTTVAQSGTALLRRLVRLLEQPVQPSTSTAAAGAGAGTLTDGETVELVSVCATLMEQVRGLTYVNPLTASPDKGESRPRGSSSTQTTTVAAAEATSASPPAVLVSSSSSVVSVTPTAVTTATASKRARSPDDGASASASAAVEVMAKKLPRTEAAPEAAVSALTGLLGTQRQLLDAATSPYASTDAVEVLLGIAPMPGSTRVLQTFAEVGHFLEPTAEATALPATVVKPETSIADDQTQDDDDDVDVDVDVENESQAEGKAAEERVTASDSDTEESATVLEVLLAASNPRPARPKPVVELVPPPPASDPAPGPACASLTSALAASWRGPVRPTPAGTAAPSSNVRDMALQEADEAARVAFAVEAFDQYEAQVAAETARQRRAAILRRDTPHSTDLTLTCPAEPPLERANPVARTPVATTSAPAPVARGPRRRVHFTEAEDAAIIKGVARFGQTSRSFMHILQAYRAVWQAGRTATKLSDHWRDALKKKALLMRIPPAPSRD